MTDYTAEAWSDPTCTGGKSLSNEEAAEGIGKLTDDELFTLYGLLQAKIHDIKAQIEADDAGLNGETTHEWRSRANTARRWHNARYQIVRAERHRRENQRDIDGGLAKQARAASHAEQCRLAQAAKMARVARSEEATKIQSKAFVETAREMLGYERYLEIWAAARIKFPERFTEDKS